MKLLIEGYQWVLPVFTELQKPSIKQRHWDAIMEVTGKEIDLDPEKMTLETLLELELHNFQEDMEEITDGADKEQTVQVRGWSVPVTNTVDQSERSLLLGWCTTHTVDQSERSLLMGWCTTHTVDQSELSILQAPEVLCPLLLVSRVCEGI